MNKVGKNVMTCCPFHKEHTPSFGVNWETGAWNCFVCQEHGKDFQSLCKKLGVRNIPEVTTDELRASMARIGKPKFTKLERISMPDEFQPLQGYGVEDYLNYLCSRKINTKTIERFGMGCCRTGYYAGRIIVPIHDEDGILVAYAGRTILDEVLVRYLYPKGVNVSTILFNYHRVRGGKDVVVVEGIFDCIKLFMEGIPSVALLGTTINARRVGLLSHFNSVILFLDNDTAGMVGASVASKMLSDNGVVVYHAVLKDYKDAGEAPIDYCKRALLSKRRIYPKEINLSI